MVFYAGINLGFGSEFESQVNEQILQSACFNLLSDLRKVSLKDQQDFNLIQRSKSTSNSDGLLLLNNPAIPDSPDVATPDSILTLPDSTALKNFNDSTSSLNNSLLNKKDSSKVKVNLDSLRLIQMSLDSTDRLKYFHYHREDYPSVTLKQKKLSKFFVEPSPSLKTRTISIDSSGKYVEIKELVAGKPNKIILTMPIEEYLKLRLSAEERRKWETLGYAYELKNANVGLSELIKSFTDFEIPLPSVGVLSIFGAPKISLKIGGAVQIHGAWRSETTEGITTSRLGNTRNEPDFKQQVQINVNGTIGDKLNISADWNTERTFEYENQLKIKYTGYEDEIIQSIEAGNVSLQTSPLVGGSEALFGIKAQFKMGPFSLTTIASQKKGETKEVSVTGGSSEVSFSKRAYEYSTNHYFIDTVYASPSLNVFNDYYGNATPQIRNDLIVVDYQVWKSTDQPTSNTSNEREANVYINLPQMPPAGYDNSLRDSTITPIFGERAYGRFILLTEGEDYIMHPETGFITFKTQINDNEMIAVAYKQERGAGSEDDAVFGEFVVASDSNSTQRLILKMVKPANLLPDYKTAWMLQLKNIYPTGVRNVNKDGFEFNIKREIEGQEPTGEYETKKFLNLFGLDLLNSSGAPTPDDLFDYRPQITIIPETGEVIFPTLQPFGANLPMPALPNEFKYDDVYNLNKTFAQQNKEKDKWLLVGKSKGTSSSTYSLGFNIVENSVKVKLNGQELVAGVDYIVDYNTGQLNIRNDAALVPGADLRITYEQNDLFQLASKTLLGARGIYEFSKKTKLGFSILNLNQQTLSDKVRIGEEPLSNSIYGIDFSTSAELPFITKLFDNIFSTREMSSINFASEFAYMNPDPNTKKSTISSDGGKSIAYIDDFEGAKKTIPIGISYTGWKDLTVPENLEFNLGLDRVEKMKHKGHAFWFTETPSTVTVQQIYGDRKKVATTDQQVSVMDFVFVPDTPGSYNWYPDLQNKRQSWGGTQKILSSTAKDLVVENIEYIEFWLKIVDAPADAKLNIDLGRISEDVIPNNILNTEDKDRNYAIDAQGKEDTGLDGKFDEEERIAYNSTKADPSEDDFSFQRGSKPYPFDYFSINGTQGNAVLSDVGKMPDTEDLNRNWTLDKENSYFSYQVPLDTSSANPFRAGGGLTSAGWYLFRIPLQDSTLSTGNPSFSNIETIRLYIVGVDSMVHFRIGEFNLVGSQWQKNLPRNIASTDTVLSISVVSIEENENYTSPPGVFQERDRTRPDQEIYSNEQSLSLVFNSLLDGQSRSAIKYLTRPLDVFNYQQMKLFLHGDNTNKYGTSSISYSDTLNGVLNYSSEVFFRFGGDTNNYYEYRQPVIAGWNEITIDFAELTAIKQLRDSLTQIIKIPVTGRPGHYYVLKGNPTLTNVKFLSVGVYNPNDFFNPGALSGDLWVNELRVVGADDTPGWAYSISSSVKLADFATVSFNYSKKDPYFHRLSERFGNRVDQSNWSISTDVNILKILPFNLSESNLHLNYSHSEQLSKPLYFPGSDVKVDEAITRQIELYANDTTGMVKSPDQIREETETQTISDSWSAANIKIKIPSKYWLIRDTFNSLVMGFNYNKAFSRSPTVLSNRSWIWNANINYAVSLSPDYFFRPVDIPVIGTLFALLKDYTGTKIYFTPQSFNFAVTARRNQNTSISRPRINPVNGQLSPQSAISSRDFVTSRGFNFSWKLTEGGFLNLSANYSLNINSSLAYLETNPDGSPRSESEIWNEIFGGAFFGRDNRYNQNFDIRTAPKLPSLFDLNKFFTLTASYSAGYQWNYDFRQEEIGRSAGFNNRSQVGLTMRWKSLFEPLFKDEALNISPDTKNLMDREKQRQRLIQSEQQRVTKIDSLDNKIVLTDTTNLLDTSLVMIENKPSAVSKAVQYLVAALKYVFLDYEMISFSFSNDNTLSKSGIKGQGTGFNNFWGLFYDANAGPTRGFMLGLSSDVGPRAFNKGTNLNDVYSQKNNFDFKTSRPLWEGAKIDISWRSGWSVNKNSTLSVADDGSIFVSSVNSSGSISRSFLTLPPVLMFSVFKSGIKHVSELYNPKDPNSNLSNAFVEGFETIPVLGNLSFLSDYSKYIPRPNWRITWDGLEKLFFFKSIADRISLDHSYSSTYTEGWRLSRTGNEEVQVQKIEYGFAPLVGLNLVFGKLWGGNLSGNLKYSIRSSYDLGISTANITENLSKDIGFTIQYSKSGFEMPLFGLSLKNDIEFSLAYSNARNASTRFNMTDFKEEGIPLDGTTRVTLEPRIKYTISAKVTLSVFYKRSSVTPEGASRIPPTTSNEAGLDVNISIN